MTASTPRRPAMLVPLASLVLLITPLGVSSATAQIPERSARFVAAELPTVRTEAAAQERALSVAAAGPIEDFAFVMGIFGGAALGALIGCAIDCSGDDGIPPTAVTGVLIGMPVGAALMFLAVRQRRR